MSTTIRRDGSHGHKSDVTDGAAPAGPDAEGPSPDDATDPLRLGGMVAIVLGLALAAWPAAPLWVLLAGVTVATAIGLPLALASTPRAASRALWLGVALVALIGAWAPYARATGDGIARDRTHDGGVTVTREAARLVARGQNPYTARYDQVLPASWAEVQGADGEMVPNPVIDHEPYLPASFLVQVPFAEAATVVGVGWDPRVLGWLALVATVVVLARRSGPAWARLAAVAAVGNAFTFTYLAWGTNDSLAVCCFVLALAVAEPVYRHGEVSSDRPADRRRLVLAGMLLAVAISCKFLFLVAVPPLAVVIAGRGSWAAVRRWWSLPATLAITCLPFLAWSPSAFLDDTIWFNLGRTEPLMPTSGLGLPAVAGGVFSGPLLAVVTLVGALVAFGVVPWMATRLRTLAWVGPLTSLGLLGLLVPARTFQVNYLVLVVAAAATGWWAVSSEPDPVESEPASAR